MHDPGENLNFPEIVESTRPELEFTKGFMILSRLPSNRDTLSLPREIHDKQTCRNFQKIEMKREF